VLGDGYYSTVQQCSIADFEKWTRDDPRNNYNSDMRLLEYCKLMLLMLFWMGIHTGQAESFSWPRWEPNLRPLGNKSNALPTELGSVWMHTKSNITNIFTWVNNTNTHNKYIVNCCYFILLWIPTYLFHYGSLQL
jgi:hypothetical protein